MNGVYDINGDLFFQLDEGGRRGHDQELFKKRFRLNISKYSFGNRLIYNWNSLSADCIHLRNCVDCRQPSTSVFCVMSWHK